jgi:hypothetical protein
MKGCKPDDDNPDPNSLHTRLLAARDHNSGRCAGKPDPLVDSVSPAAIRPVLTRRWLSTAVKPFAAVRQRESETSVYGVLWGFQGLSRPLSERQENHPMLQHGRPVLVTASTNQSGTELAEYLTQIAS